MFTTTPLTTNAPPIKTLGVQATHLNQSAKEEAFVAAAFQLGNLFQLGAVSSISHLLECVMNGDTSHEAFELIRKVLRPNSDHSGFLWFKTEKEFSVTGQKFLALLAIIHDPSLLDSKGHIKVEETQAVIRTLLGDPGAYYHLDAKAIQHLCFKDQSMTFGKRRLNKVGEQLIIEKTRLDQTLLEIIKGQRAQHLEKHAHPVSGALNTINPTCNITNQRLLVEGDGHGDQSIGRRLIQAGIFEIKDPEKWTALETRTNTHMTTMATYREELDKKTRGLDNEIKQLNKNITSQTQANTKEKRENLFKTNPTLQEEYRKEHTRIYNSNNPLENPFIDKTIKKSYTDVRNNLHSKTITALLNNPFAVQLPAAGAANEPPALIEGALANPEQEDLKQIQKIKDALLKIKEKMSDGNTSVKNHMTLQGNKQTLKDALKEYEKAKKKLNEANIWSKTFRADELRQHIIKTSLRTQEVTLAEKEKARNKIKADLKIKHNIAQELQFLKNFPTLLREAVSVTEAAKARDSGLMRFLGDLLSDRGQSDSLMLDVFALLKEENVKYDILFSNHDGNFVNWFLDLPHLENTGVQGQSLYNMVACVEDDPGFIQQIKQKAKDAYFSNLKLFEYDPEARSFFAHAPVNRVLYEKILLEALKKGGQIPATATSLEGYPRQSAQDEIQIINTWFSKSVQDKDIYRKIYSRDNKNPDAEKLLSWVVSFVGGVDSEQAAWYPDQPHHTFEKPHRDVNYVIHGHTQTRAKASDETLQTIQHSHEKEDYLTLDGEFGNQQVLGLEASLKKLKETLGEETYEWLQENGNEDFQKKAKAIEQERATGKHKASETLSQTAVICQTLFPNENTTQLAQACETLRLKNLGPDDVKTIYTYRHITDFKNIERKVYALPKADFPPPNPPYVQGDNIPVETIILS